MPDTAMDALRGQLEHLSTEAIGDHLDLDTMSTRELVDTMNDVNDSVAAAVAVAAPAVAAATDVIVERLQRGGRLIYIGAGTSGRLGILDASEIPPTFGTAPELVVGIIAGGDTAIRSAIENAEDDDTEGARAIADLDVGANDVVAGISASGRTPYVAGALREARRRGAATVAVANNTSSLIGSLSDVAIEVVTGPEFVAGSTRLKSGTAQKLVLNALTTVAMIRLGKVYGNLMVDLRATNAKLRARAQRTVMLATGVTHEQAASALEATEGRVKPAVLMCTAGVGSDEAVAAIDRHGGRLREALTELTSRET